MSSQKIVLIGNSGLVNTELARTIPTSLLTLRHHDLEVVSFREAVSSNSASIPKGADVYVIGGRMGAHRDDIDNMAHDIIMDSPRPVAVIDLSPTHRGDEDWDCITSAQDLEMVLARDGDVLRLTQPGCIATAAIVALRPLVDAGLLSADERLYLDVTTGTSTGGTELEQRFKDEAIVQSNHSLVYPHQHVAEIQRALGIENKIVLMPKVVNRDRNINLFVHLPNVSFEQADEAFVCPSAAGRGVRQQPMVPVKKLFSSMTFLTAYCAYWPAPSGEGTIVQVVMDNIMRGSVLPAIDLIDGALKHVSSR